MKGSFRRRLTALIAVVFVVGGAALLGVQYLLVMRLLEQQVDEQTVETVVQVPDHDSGVVEREVVREPIPERPSAATAAQACPEGTDTWWMVSGVGEFPVGGIPLGSVDPDTPLWGLCRDDAGDVVHRFELNLTRFDVDVDRFLHDDAATPKERAELLTRVISETTTRTTTHVSQEVLRSLALWSVGMLATFAAVAVTAAWWLSRRSLGRIARITAATRAISHDDLDRRLDLPGPADEIKELGDTIDAMLDRIEDAFTRQDRFIAGASHELRTPLTTTRTLLEIPLDQGRFPDDVAPAVRGALEANARSERLIAALLTLARSRRSAHSTTPDDGGAVSGGVTDLRDLTAALLTEREAEAAQRDVTLAPLRAAASAAPRPLPDDVAHAAAPHATSAGPVAPASSAGGFSAGGALPVAADPGFLTLAIGNLLDNAVKHNRPGGTVEVRCGETPTATWVEVSNDGADLTATDLDALREPFHRGDRSRLAGEGLGLGLALVDTVATAVGGTLHLTARPQGGLTARLSVPRDVS